MIKETDDPDWPYWFDWRDHFKADHPYISIPFEFKHLEPFIKAGKARVHSHGHEGWDIKDEETALKILRIFELMP